MKEKISAILTEAEVRKAVISMKENPGRSLRNLVEMGINFCKGDFQKKFFTKLLKILQDENSLCYRQLEKIIENASSERLITLGMNIGYNSLTAGADLIRNNEKKLGFNIPWNIALEISGKEYSENPGKFNKILYEGMQLGIYTYMIFSKDSPDSLLQLAEKNPEVSIIMFLNSNDADEKLINESEKINNVIFVLEIDEESRMKSERFIEKGIIYSYFYKYSKTEADEKYYEKILEISEEFNPFFTVFIPDESCPLNVTEKVYNSLKAAREEQKYTTIPIDYIYDNMAIDSVISNDSCCASFNLSGDMYGTDGKTEKKGFNIYEKNLESIFREAFPKE